MPRHKRASNQPMQYDEDDDGSRSGEKPGQRNAANARERARMRILSKAFSRLKTTLPWVPPDTKLSKLDTLRLATSYIAHLRTILTDDGSPAPIVHPLNLTWPFTIQQQTSDQSSRSPDEWSSEEQNQSNRTSVHFGLMSGCESLPGPDRDVEDSPRHFSKSHHYSEHRHHYSDSLLNIG
ncbi:UNVERIFIED_CONTAM: hypothetical protein PYX00_008448 [Menopon gallinae]|uniref:BHLH domain-containing protein n=1 Tax=Menopon gallinae TaxID=328185 RepID=A0AAW2HMX8_9NEOP